MLLWPWFLLMAIGNAIWQAFVVIASIFIVVKNDATYALHVVVVSMVRLSSAISNILYL